MPARAQAAPRPRAEALEERLLYAADAAPAALAAAAEALGRTPDDGPVLQRLVGADAAGFSTATPLSTPLSSSQAAERSDDSIRAGTEIVFIDAAVPDASRLLADLQAQRDAGRDVQAVWIGADEDGLAVIGAALAGRENLSAVHLVAHGEPGALQLGRTRLDADTLLQRAGEVAAWGEALGAQADLLIYGCDLAAQPVGAALLADLAALTGADVAASTDATGAAARGGDWTLEAATGAIQAARAFSATAEAQWAGLLASPAPSSTGTAVWTEAGFASPQTGAWDGRSLSAAQQASAVTAGWVNLTGAASHTRDELIVAGVDASGVIRAQLWNGSSWSEVGGGALGTATVGDRMSVAVAYEKSGDAVLVWDNGSGLSYRVWNGSSWTAAQGIALAGSEPQYLQLVSNPVRDEMVLVVSDAAADDRALVWNGSAWGHRALIDTSNTTRLLQTSLAVAYESVSGHALVAWAEADDPNVYYATWNGTQWSSAQAASSFGSDDDDDDDGSSLVPQFIKLASDPRTDRLALAVTLTDGSRASQSAFALWSGSGWSSLVLPSSGNDIGSAADVAFDSRSGTLLAVYQGSDNKLHYRTHTAANGWSADASGPDVGNKPMALDLVADPGSSRIMLAAQRDNGLISYVAWDSGAWDTASLRQVGSSAANTAGAQPFTFLWSTYTAPKTHTLWVSPDASSSSPGWSGVHTTASSALLELGPAGLQYGSSSGGTFAHLLDLRALANGSNAASFNLDDVVLVSRDLTLAGGLQLRRGDILFSTNQPVTLTGNSALASNSAVTAAANDVLIYRPDAAGDLSRGQLAKLVEGLGASLLGGASDIKGLALVEQATPIAGQNVAAGTLLFTVGDSRVLRYTPTGVLLGLLTGSTSVLLDGAAVGVDAGIRALDVVSAPVTLPGGVSLAAGSLLLALNGGDGAVGSNGLAVQQEDVLALHATSASAATAQLVLDGSDVGAGTVGFDALALSLDQAPVITSHGGAANVALTQAEGTRPVLTTVTATDAEGGPLSVSLLGADAARFTINAQGQLRLASTPDHEAPADADGDNVYQVRVRVSDGTEWREQAFAVTVTNANEAPQITTHGGGAYAALWHPSGGTAVTTVAASDPDAGAALTWQLLPDGDAALFSIDPSTGALSFNSPPAVVAGGDNTYDVTVRVSDGSLSDDQRLSITVTQGTAPIAFAGGANASHAVAEGQREVAVLLASGGSGPLAYMLTGGDTDRFEIVTVGSDTVLRFIQPPDFEAGDGRTSFAVVVQASDGSDSATQSVMVQVQDVQPTLALPTGPLAGLEDQPLAVAGLQIGSDDVAASDSVVLTLSVGQGRLQVAAGSGVSLVGNGQASVTLSGTRADINALLAGSGALSFLPAADASGSETLQAQLTAPGGAATASVALSVAAANDAPVAGAPLADAPAQAGQPFRLDLPAGAFTDVDAADSLRYALTLGNGQPAPGWLSVSATTGRLQGTPGAADAGTLDLILIATDDGGAQATQALRIVVSPAPPTPPPPQPAPPEPAPPPLVLPPALPAEPATADSATPAAESGTDAPQDSSMEAAATGSPAPAGPAPAPADAALRPAPAWLAGLDVAPPAAGRGMAFELRDWRVDPPPAGTLLPAAWAAAGLPDWQGSSLTPLAQAVQSASLSQALDTLHQQLTEQVIEHRQAIASSIAVTTGLSVGYVIWLVRGGVLLGSMLSAMPAWQMIDPLPVLTRSRVGPGAGTDGGEPADDVDALFDGDAPAGAGPAAAPSRAPAAVSQAEPAARPTREAVR